MKTFSYWTIPGIPPKKLTKENILDACIKHFNIDFKTLSGKRTDRKITVPRQVTMYFLRIHLKMTYLEIGELFNRDHTTAMHSCDLVKDCKDTPEFNIHIIAISDDLSHLITF